ncbi:Tripeptidyl peptidase II-domain-containing protein [Entophlyctis helioformis]|nr:Tripeptidyl peptidase II-domain-containing protein [Entophlyctis helioformis]
MAPSSVFPVDGLLPKQETEAAAFLAKNPAFDGRGTLVAILDTGVDPGAAGMQVTSDGRPKITALIDCTGSGDVPCKTEVTATLETAQDGSSVRTLKGLSGRTLRLGNWACPSNKFRLGLKHSADLFPIPLVSRLKKDRKEKFDLEHHALTTKVQNEALALDASLVGKSADEATLIKSDYKARLDVLKELIKSYEDPGILMDCVVFHDGTTWRAVVDLSETGDLTNGTALASFSEEHQFLRFNDDNMLNFSVNIYDNGEMLSIVTLGGSHGTHVAAITAANHPEDPRLNGVAPGAQIVSLKIGDTRLSTMETGTGLVRAAIELARLNIDLANISYGEAAANPNYGRFIELLRDDVINKKGCIVTSSTVIGVGAYVSHAMMDAEYALLDKVEERPYTWSSRGPTIDGDIGVDIFAPGAAITSVPQYTSDRTQLMNGTSMSSPNCCGCLALLVSGLKASNIPYTPYLVKAAIQATGKDISDPLGTRFIQVAKSWEFLSSTSRSYLPSTLHYNVKVSTRDNARGVYLRDLVETSEVQECMVDVQPLFPNKDDPSVLPQKLSLELQLVMRSSDRWISTPDFVLVNSSGRSFKIRVDPTNLAPGLHAGCIEAFDAKKPDVGALFKIPITVCKPEQTAHKSISVQQAQAEAGFIKYDSLRFTPGSIHRKFIHVPMGANFAELVVRSENRETPAALIVHLLQLNPQSRYPTFERVYGLRLASSGSGSPDDDFVQRKHFAVLPNVTIELCVAQMWSSLDPSTVSIEVRFHGIQAAFSSNTNGGFGATSGSGGSLQHINPGSYGFTRVDVSVPIRNETVQPSASFDTLRKTFRPTEYAITPLQSRDVLPDGRQLHQIVLSYTFKLAEGASVTPRIPRLQDVLYDSSLDNFSLFVFDANKRLVGVVDVYAKTFTLPEGTYTVRVQVVSKSLEVLEKLQTLPLLIDVSVKAVSLTAYNTLADSIEGNSAGVFKSKAIDRGQRTTFWLGEAPAASMPKDAKAGDLLVGKLDITPTKLDGVLYNLAYIVPPEAKKEADSDVTLVGDKVEVKDDPVLASEAVRDLEISWIKKMTKDADRDALLAKLEAAHPDHLPLLKQKLEVLADKMQKTAAAPATAGDKPAEDDIFARVVETTNQILRIVDESQIARYFGVQHDVAKGGEKQRAEKKEMEFQKELPANALSTDGQYLLLWAWRNRLRGHHGTVLKAVNKFIADPKNAANEETAKGPLKAAFELRAELLSELGWKLWADYDEKWRIKKFPADFANF